MIIENRKRKFRTQASNLKNEVTEYLKRLAVFKVGVANPDEGFEKVIPGCHPKKIMDSCKSVIVFAMHIGLDFYTAINFNNKVERIGHLFIDSVSLKLVSLLKEKGYNSFVPFGFYDEQNRIAHLSKRLCAYEAGIGIYGRSGLIITKDYGPKVNLGVVLTDAFIPPDRKMEGFNPCKECSICMNICPVNAIGKGNSLPCLDRQKCLRFVLNLRRITENEVRLCGYCYDFCLNEEVIKQTMSWRKWKAIFHIEPIRRKQLIKKAGGEEKYYVTLGK